MSRLIRALAVALTAAVLAAPQASADPVLTPGARLWVNPDSTTVEAARHLQGADRANALELAAVASANWLTTGTPAEVRKDAFTATWRANRHGEVPVLAAYNIPGRDCSQYSAGGASNTREYKAWIAGLTEGINVGRAAVILEPDGIALAPSDCGGSPERQAQRVRQMNYAVDRLQSLPRTAVYLDAGHSAWHDVGTIAARLVANGIDESDGFFLNVSNYRTNTDLIRYGTMVSKCIAYIVELDKPSGDCANQYWPPADADAWYATHVPTPVSQLTHFVIDEPQRPGPLDTARG